MQKKFMTGLAIGINILCFVCITNAEVYDGVDFPGGASSFADKWIYYNPTNNVKYPYNNPAASLGIPDGNDEHATSLGDQGVLVLKFTNNSLTTSGDDSADLWIFETGIEIEPTSVDISTDGRNWINVGETTGGKYGIDIDKYLSSGVVLNEKYSYVRLTDLLPHQSGNPYEGADIDAVGAISSAPPVPNTKRLIFGTIWLLLK